MRMLSQKSGNNFIKRDKRFRSKNRGVKYGEILEYFGSKCDYNDFEEVE